MAEFALSYREVIPDQTVSEPWKEIILNTGGTQSILQDIKFVDIADGFVYKDSTKHYTRNRFIYWRISNDILELFEHSLDVNLTGNRVRYRFVDTPILDGVSIHETGDSVIVLVPTVCSVHRLIFPHPRKFHQSDELLGIYPDLSSPSIFSEANEVDARNPLSYYLFSGPCFANSQLPHLASSTLAPNEDEALFILVYPWGEILLVRLHSQGHNSCVELKNESIMPRFLSGIADKLRSKTNDGDVVVSLVLHKVESETYLICLTRDGHLKIWSCLKNKCLAVINILTEIGENVHGLVQGGQNHILQKAVDGNDEECLLSVFLCFSNLNGFYIFKPIFNEGNIKVIRLNNLHSPEEDLIDFKMTLNRIWSAWRSHDGDCKVYSACIRQRGFDANNLWMPVILEEPPESTPPQIEGESDPSQVYLRYIFHPGRFPLHIINKALNIYKRSTVQTEVNLTPALLKQRISMAIHNEIQKELKETEVSDEDYIERANWCWQRFYSCVEQYHVAGLKPLGILLLPGVSGAVFLKKSMFSFFRPLDTLEHMLLCSEFMNEEQFIQTPGLSEDPSIIPDVMQVMEALVYLNSQMSEVFSFIFEKEMFQLRSPDEVMEELYSKILTEMDSEFTVQISKMLYRCENLYRAVHKLLELVRDAHNNFDNDNEGKAEETLLHLFNSQLGVSLVTQSLNQMACTRFTICRNLLLICNVIFQHNKFPAEVLEAIRSVCSPEIVVLTQASYAVLWLSNLTALPIFSHDVLQKRLAPLKLSPVFKLRNTTSSLVSVLELFVGSTGGYTGHKNFAKSVKFSDMSNIQYWHNSLLPYLSQLLHIIWPISKDPILAEWLLSSGQHVWLQEYVRLLSHWCEWNDCTRLFLLACSLLLTGENYKAMELFQSASKGILTDSFIIEKTLKHCDEDRPSKLYVHYYLKVIQLFELNNADDYAIQIANTALSSNLVIADDPLSATLYSIKFKNHLKLRHYTYAFDSLNLNPDVNRRYDNLRDLVKCLLDENRMDVLIAFNYGNLEEAFCEIILSRARAVDCIKNVFYDFLYSYYIRKGPAYYRLAGSAMYEQAFRLMYNNNIDALEKQVKCYLACINVLRLIDPKNAWVVRPKENEEQNEIVLPVEIGSSNEPYTITLEKEIDALDLQEIKKEYEFACARLKLARYTPNSYENWAATTPSELIIALVSAGLYKVALSFCKTLELPYEPIFEAITAQCVLLTEDENPESNWEWLPKNDTPDLLMANNCAADVAWLFLENLLKEYEEPGLTTLHKAVVQKIIHMAAFIPHWILASYKLRNAPELIRLMHFSGRIDEAVEVAKGYMLAILGHGKEYYGLKESLTATSDVVYCPLGAIADLIQELELQIKCNNGEDLIKEHEILNDLFKDYMETISRISNDMCKYKFSVAQPV